jgi:hypothetical protein
MIENEIGRGYINIALRGNVCEDATGLFVSLTTAYFGMSGAELLASQLSMAVLMVKEVKN